MMIFHAPFGIVAVCPSDELLCRSRRPQVDVARLPDVRIWVAQGVSLSFHHDTLAARLLVEALAEGDGIAVHLNVSGLDGNTCLQPPFQLRESRVWSIGRQLLDAIEQHAAYALARAEVEKLVPVDAACAFRQLRVFMQAVSQEIEIGVVGDDVVHYLIFL